MKEYFVYILASQKNGTLYVGVTNDLVRRIYEHKNNFIEEKNPQWCDLYNDLNA